MISFPCKLKSLILRLFRARMSALIVLKRVETCWNFKNETTARKCENRKNFVRIGSSRFESLTRPSSCPNIKVWPLLSIVYSKRRRESEERTRVAAVCWIGVALTCKNHTYPLCWPSSSKLDLWWPRRTKRPRSGSWSRSFVSWKFDKTVLKKMDGATTDRTLFHVCFFTHFTIFFINN